MNESPHVLGNRYEVGDLLGRGGMAEVHLGRDARLGRTVAIKLLRSDLARDPTFQARFRREAQSAAGLNHPAIVAVYDTGEETALDAGGAPVALPYIVMEYVQGRTLRDYIERARARATAGLPEGAEPPPAAGALDVESALRVTRGVLSALEYSHRSGIVHRDIKPANVMVTPTGEVKVMDFGIARALADVSATMTQTQAVIGTAQYLSPEQARGEAVDARSDLYSTGCLLYELLTGRPPFIGDSPVAVAYQHVREYPQPPSTINPAVPESVDRIVMHALTKDRDIRYQSAEEFAADIEAARRGGPVTAPTVAVGAGLAGAAATEYLGAGVPPTQAMAGYGGPTSVLPGAPQDGDPYAQAATPYDGDYRRPRQDDTAKKRALAIAAVIAGVIAVIALGWYLLYGNTDPEPPAQVTVPSLAGLTEDAARAELTKLGLKMTKETAAHATVPAGQVISQDPKAGERVDPSSAVVVTFSTGVGSTEVPDVEGMSQEDAIAALEEAGLRVSRVDRVNAPGVDPDEAVGTDPEAGTSLDRGASVVLKVASGDVEVPRVTGKSQEQAEKALRDAGLSFRVIEAESTQQSPGTVIDQDPGAGERVSQDTTVTITVAKAPPSTTSQPTTTSTTSQPTTTTTSPTETAPEPPGNGDPGNGNGFELD